MHEHHDIFLLASEHIDNGSEEIGVFGVLHVLSQGPPLIKRTSSDSLIKLCRSQYEPTKNDLAAGSLCSDLKPLLAKQPDTCKEIHGSLRDNLRKDTASLYTSFIVKN